MNHPAPSQCPSGGDVVDQMERGGLSPRADVVDLISERGDALNDAGMRVRAAHLRARSASDIHPHVEE